ncbi:MAG: hypothetical protein IKS63_03210 [Firmicutes bacterium]|nr:hypothetical protein [Bacillota bacterium]
MMSEADWLSGISNGVFDFAGIISQVDPCSESGLELTLRAAEREREEVSLTALTFGGALSDKTLRTLYALGFDECVRIDGQPDPFFPEKTAKTIAGICEEGQGFDLIVLGAQSQDGNNKKTAYLLAEYLGMPFAGNVTEYYPAEGNRIKVTREVPEGICEETLDLPLVISVGDVPETLLRVPTLMQRKAAAGREITVVSFDKESAAAPFDVQTAAECPAIEVEGFEYVDQNRNGELIAGDSPEEIAQILYERFIGRQI